MQLTNDNLKFYSMLVAVGIAWGTLYYQNNDNHETLKNIDVKFERIDEKFDDVTETTSKNRQDIIRLQNTVESAQRRGELSIAKSDERSLVTLAAPTLSSATEVITLSQVHIESDILCVPILGICL